MAAITRIGVEVDGVEVDSIDFQSAISGLSSGAHTITVKAYSGAAVASSQTRNVTVAAGNFLLDTYAGGALGLSLERLKADYSGTVVSVRNDSNVTSQFALSGNALDITAIDAHIGSGGGYVAEWYSQILGIKFIQPNSANQPKIATGGNIITLNGKPAIEFDGVDDFLYHDGLNSVWTFLHNGAKNMLSIVASSGKTSRGDIFGNITTSGDSGVIISLPIDAAGKVRISHGNGGVNIGASNTSSNSKNGSGSNIIVQHSDNGNATAAERSYLKLNGVLTKANTITAAPSTAAPSKRMGIGSISGESSGIPFSGKIQEIVAWNANLLSELDNIETSVTNRYVV